MRIARPSNHESFDGRWAACAAARSGAASGNAHNPGLAYTPAIGFERAGMIATAFREECETRLFGELAVLSAALKVRLFG